MDICLIRDPEDIVVLAFAKPEYAQRFVRNNPEHSIQNAMLDEGWTETKPGRYAYIVYSRVGNDVEKVFTALADAQQWSDESGYTEHPSMVRLHRTFAPSDWE